MSVTGRKVMSLEEMNQVAWFGNKLLIGPIRGVVLKFHSLGSPALKTTVNEENYYFGARGLLTVIPYSGPWSWMNRSTRAFVDRLVEAIYAHFSLDNDVPLLSIGANMGGHGALLYTRYAKARPVSGCVAMAPVCDLKIHFRAHPDLPRTIRYAFRDYDENLEDLFIEHSPLFQVDQMPTVPYCVVHGEKDTVVNKGDHSDRFVLAMKARGLSVTYLEAPLSAHGDIPPEVEQQRREFICSFVAPHASK